MSSQENAEAIAIFGCLILAMIVGWVGDHGVEHRPLTPDELKEKDLRDRDERVTNGLRHWLDSFRRPDA